MVSDQRDPTRFKFVVVVGVVMFVAGVLDSLTLIRGLSLLGLIGIVWAVASAVLVVVAVHRLRREVTPPR